MYNSTLEWKQDEDLRVIQALKRVARELRKGDEPLEWFDRIWLSSAFEALAKQATDPDKPSWDIRVPLGLSLKAGRPESARARQFYMALDLAFGQISGSKLEIDYACERWLLNAETVPSYWKMWRVQAIEVATKAVADDQALGISQSDSMVDHRRGLDWFVPGRRHHKGS